MNFAEIAKKKGWDQAEQVDALLDLVAKHVDEAIAVEHLESAQGYDDGLSSFEVLAQWPEGDTWCEKVRARDLTEAKIAALDAMADAYGVDLDDPEEVSSFRESVTFLNID